MRNCVAFLTATALLTALSIFLSHSSLENHADVGVQLHLADSIVEVRASALALSLNDADARDLDAALTAAAGASLEQEQTLSDLIFNKAKFMLHGSHSNGSKVSFSTQSLRLDDQDVQFFVQFSHSDVRSLIALQAFAGGRILTHVQDRLFLAAGGSKFQHRAKMFPGVLWVQERHHSSKIGKKLQQLLRNPGRQSQLSVKVIAECWFDGCGAAAVALKNICPDVYVHPSLVEGRCSEPSVAAAAQILSSHVAVNVVDVKRKIVTKNFGSRAIVGSGPDALAPDESLVLRINTQQSVIGVADSGIDMNNCFFYDKGREKPWNNSRVVHSYSFDSCDVCGTCCGKKSRPDCSNEKNACGNYIEQSYHGSHVCGTIAGQSDALPYGDGIAAGARIYFHDTENILNDTECYEPRACNGLNSPSDLLNLFSSQYSAGVRVSSNSYGGIEQGIYSVGSRSIDEFVVANPTFIVIWAAGNSGDESFAGSVEDEANCKNCLSVGATQLSDELYRTMSAFDDGGSFCRENTTKSLIDPCCNNSITCVNRCCDYTSALNMSLSCCATQTSCSGNSECSIASGNIRSARNVAFFSSRGPSLDGRFKPDIVAPGENVMSAASPEQSKPDEPFVTTAKNHCVVPNNTRPRTRAETFNVALQKMSGTSFSTPLVAGAVEKIRQYFVQGYYPEGFKDSGARFEPEEALVRAVVIASCVSAATDSKSWGMWTTRLPNSPDFFRYSIPLTTPNIFYGFGLPVLDRAVFMKGSTNGYNMLFVNDTFYSSKISTLAYSIACKSTSPLPLTLAMVWTDPPGNVISQIQIVNDLDLIVLIPGSSPSQLFGNMRSFADTANTVERVTTTCPSSGYVTAVITLGKRLATASQAWYLVANGPVTSITPTIALNYSTGRVSIFPETQSRPCSLDSGIVVHLKFKQTLAWACAGVRGRFDCGIKQSVFATTLAQLLRVSAVGINVQSSDATGILITFVCSWMVSAGQLQYVTASALLTAIRGLCAATDSFCAMHEILGVFDWTTITVVPPGAANVVVTFTGYEHNNCTSSLPSVGNNSVPNPFSFDDKQCLPGHIFDNVQLFFRAKSCAANATFVVSKKNPSCSESASPPSAALSFVQGACVDAATVFKNAGIDSQASADPGDVPASFVFTCHRVASSSESNACPNGKLCLGISDGAFYTIISLLLVLHVAQAVAWAVCAKRWHRYSLIGMCFISILPVLGLVYWLPLRCRWRKTAHPHPHNNRLLESELQSGLTPKNSSLIP